VLLIKHDGSVTKTAQELGLNKASVSKQIRPLVLGTPPWLPRPWLMKQGKRFVLTDEGRAMLPAATEHSERWRRFSAFASLGNTPGLTVACGQESAGTVVLKAATAFRRQHPSAPFRIAVVRGRRRIEGVANGLYDLALVTHNPGAIREIARREVILDPLADDVLMLACSPKSPWAAKFADAKRPITFKEMQDWPMVLPEAESAIRKQWDERMQRQKAMQVPRAAVEVGGWRVLLGYVLADFGVGLLPHSIIAAAGAKLLSRPLPETLRPANHLYLVRLPQSSNEELIEAFVGALEDC
jgi:DNA-binding transcriptional LysR family regulator